MATAHYMLFRPGHKGARDRTGGLPSHLPTEFPKCMECGREMAFLAQFYCSADRLPIEDALYVQLYQCDCFTANPTPTAVKVPMSVPENTANLGRICPLIQPFDIEWDRRDDPDEVDLNDVSLADSKAGGTPFDADIISPSEEFLLQILDYPANFNFPGRSAVLLKRGQSLIVRLA